MTALHCSAVWYANHGLPVFPLAPRKKNPITDHGLKDATKDPFVIDAWWKDNPEANIGIPMGTPSQLLLLDVDFWATDGRVECRADVIETLGEIPDTAEVETGRGRHFYFRFPGGKVPAKIAKGVDLKADGGYAVAPPSIHPNGKTYTFDGSDEKAILHPAPPPKWLLEEIAEPNQAGARSRKSSTDEKWPQGERNTTLAGVAGKLRYAGLSVDAIEAALLAANRIHCDPPLSDAEVKKIARSIGRYPPGPSHPRYAAINIDSAEPSLELLNSLAIFEGRVRFISLHRRGQMIVAKFADGAEAIWPSITELKSFSKAQAIIADATDILISTPSNQKVRAMWEPAVQLILQLATGDKVPIGAALREEFREILRSVWERAGSPIADKTEQFVELLQQCSLHYRDPHRGPPCCCIWIAEDACWVHQPQLMDFLSTPLGKNRHYPWEIVRSALLLLDFRPVKSVTRSAGGIVAKANVWRGPKALLDD
jgi:hypothetical protein